jgi:hypothetical protein
MRTKNCPLFAYLRIYRLPKALASLGLYGDLEFFEKV